jgi:hypothetical protein
MKMYCDVAFTVAHGRIVFRSCLSRLLPAAAP